MAKFKFWSGKPGGKKELQGKIDKLNQTIENMKQELMKNGKVIADLEARNKILKDGFNALEEEYNQFKAKKKTSKKKTTKKKSSKKKSTRKKTTRKKKT